MSVILEVMMVVGTDGRLSLSLDQGRGYDGLRSPSERVQSLSMRSGLKSAASHRFLDSAYLRGSPIHDPAQLYHSLPRPRHAVRQQSHGSHHKGHSLFHGVLRCRVHRADGCCPNNTVRCSAGRWQSGTFLCEIRGFGSVGGTPGKTTYFDARLVRTRVAWVGVDWSCGGGGWRARDGGVMGMGPRRKTKRAARGGRGPWRGLGLGWTNLPAPLRGARSIVPVDRGCHFVATHG